MAKQVSVSKSGDTVTLTIGKVQQGSKYQVVKLSVVEAVLVMQAIQDRLSIK